MKWIAISGSWQKINKKVENDIRGTVREVVSRGDGIISGGALSADYVAADEVLNADPDAKKIKIFLPSPLEVYADHYRKRAKEKVITKKQADDLISQLSRIRAANSSALIENKDNGVVDQGTYFARNTLIVEAADELIAFHVNESPGTRDTIEKAHQKGIPVKVFSYKIKK